MNQTTFDPDAFMQQQVGDAMSTTVRLIPEKEYQAMVGDFTKDAFEQIDFTYKKGKRAGQEGSMTKFACPFILQDELVKADLGRENRLVAQSAAFGNNRQRQNNGLGN